jgi:outer membrane protein OmpA-like peptidoglycan-associated protein
LPKPPRRLILASLLAAGIAGVAVLLGGMGYVTAPKTESFRFARSTVFADGEEDQLRRFLLAAVQDDRVKVVIVGHSGTAGDAEANQQLSLSRAVVAEQIAVGLGIPPDNVSAVGLGGAAPLDQADGVGERAWQAQLARVDVTLQVRR